MKKYITILITAFLITKILRSDIFISKITNTTKKKALIEFTQNENDNSIKLVPGGSYNLAAHKIISVLTA